VLTAWPRDPVRNYESLHRSLGFTGGPIKGGASTLRSQVTLDMQFITPNWLPGLLWFIFWTILRKPN
jgi:hypothetical protein